MATPHRLDRVLDAFGHRYRRRLLLALLEHNPQDDDDAQDAQQALGAITADGEDEEVVETQLLHNHLPKLEEYGYITWDRETGKIAKGPEWAEIAPLLALLTEHKDELPEDWL